MHRPIKPAGIKAFIAVVAAILVAACLSSTGWADSQKSFFRSDLVFPPKGFGRPHGASLIEIKDGNLLVSWFSSEIETGDDAQIFGSYWEKATGKWEKPFTIVPSDYSKSLGNTALFRDDDQIIWLFFAAVQVGGWSGSMVDYIQSNDDGKSWNQGKRLVGWLGNLPRNMPIKTGDHQLLVPLFIDFWYEVGLTGSYTASIKYDHGKIIEKHYASLQDKDAIQPTVVKLPNGSILLLARDKSGRFIRRAYSHDNGKSWVDESITTLPNPDSAIAAIYVEELKAVLLVYNHSLNKRNPLSMALSFDNGKTFERIDDLEYDKENPDATFSYPVLLRTEDGLIHAVWSHSNRDTLKHVYFNVEWLQQKLKKAKNK